MARIMLATWIVALSALGLGSAQANALLSFESCTELRRYLDSLGPYAEVRLAHSFYDRSWPINLSVDGLSVDFGGSTVRVADHALRPGVLCSAACATMRGRWRNSATSSASPRSACARSSTARSRSSNPRSCSAPPSPTTSPDPGFFAAGKRRLG